MSTKVDWRVWVSLGQGAGLGAVIDKSRHLWMWRGDIMFASKIVDKITAVHSSIKSVTRWQHQIIFTVADAADGHQLTLSYRPIL